MLSWGSDTGKEPTLSIVVSKTSQWLKGSDSSVFRHETFQIFGRFQIFLVQNIISKGVGFHLKVTNTLILTGGIRAQSHACVLVLDQALLPPDLMIGIQDLSN